MTTLIENYKSYIQVIKADKLSQIETYRNTHCEDEAALAQIEFNIIEVFEQMFAVSEKKALANKNDPKEGLKIAFLGFFDKIPSAWHVNLEKCQKFGDAIEGHKETLKINQANAMRQRFLEMYEEV